MHIGKYWILLSNLLHYLRRDVVLLICAQCVQKLDVTKHLIINMKNGIGDKIGVKIDSNLLSRGPIIVDQLPLVFKVRLPDVIWFQQQFRHLSPCLNVQNIMYQSKKRYLQNEGEKCMDLIFNIFCCPSWMMITFLVRCPSWRRQTQWQTWRWELGSSYFSPEFLLVTSMKEVLWHPRSMNFTGK